MDKDLFGILNCSVRALIIAAHKNRPAPIWSGDIDCSVFEEDNPLADQFNPAPFCIHLPLNRAIAGRNPEENLSVPLFDAQRICRAAVLKGKFVRVSIDLKIDPAGVDNARLIEKCADLTAGVWVLESTFIAVQTSTTADLAPDSSAQMFYRARLAP